MRHQYEVVLHVITKLATRDEVKKAIDNVFDYADEETIEKLNVRVLRIEQPAKNR